MQRWKGWGHSLSQQGIFWTPKTSKITFQVTQRFWKGIYNNVNFLRIIEYFSPRYNSHDMGWYYGLGTNISTCPLAPASELLIKECSGKYILVNTCLNG